MLLNEPSREVSCQLRTLCCLMGKIGAVDTPLNIVKGQVYGKPINDGH